MRGRYRDLGRAAAHLEKAIELDDQQPHYLASYGILCLKLDRVEEGLAALTRAMDLMPNDPGIVKKLVTSLWRTNRAEEAERVLRAARFRNSRDRRFEQLWNDFRFQQLIRKQKAQREAEPDQGIGDNARIILPFVRLTNETGTNTPRQDNAEPLPGPHPRRPSRRPNQKHG